MAPVEYPHSQVAAEKLTRSAEALGDDEVAAQRRRVLATEADVQVAKLSGKLGLEGVVELVSSVTTRTRLTEVAGRADRRLGRDRRELAVPILQFRVRPEAGGANGYKRR